MVNERVNDLADAEIAVSLIRSNSKITSAVFHNLVSDVYNLNAAKGWFTEPRTVGDMVALMHSEVSEVLEAYRDFEFKDATAHPAEIMCTCEYPYDAHPGQGHHPTCRTNFPPKPEGVGAEMADCLIRLLDMAKRWGVDLQKEYERKMIHNWTRPYRHGRKHL